MPGEVAVGLATAAVAGLAVLSSTFTTIRSIGVQRENTLTALEVQRQLAEAQERALRERPHAEAIRERRTVIYTEVVHWAYRLLEALSGVDHANPSIPRQVWHIAQDVEDGFDLYSSEGVHIHFNALRGLLIGLVENSGFGDSPVVKWDENEGEVSNVRFDRTPSLDEWSERSKVVDEAHQGALALVGRIRSEMQSRHVTQFFVTYRLAR